MNTNRTPPDQYHALLLSLLAGMSHLHEARLEREGIDNIENFSTADPVSLAVSTGFTYPQLAQWISVAWLVMHLREITRSLSSTRASPAKTNWCSF